VYPKVIIIELLYHVYIVMALTTKSGRTDALTHSHCGNIVELSAKILIHMYFIATNYF